MHVQVFAPILSCTSSKHSAVHTREAHRSTTAFSCSTNTSSMRNPSISIVLYLLLGTAALSHAARLLRQDPYTYTTTKGQNPNGLYAMAGKAEAGASGDSQGVRYNAGSITTSGDIPAPASEGASNLPSGNTGTRSGNLADDANMVIGREVIAATGYGARAAAGTDVAQTAGRDAAVSSTTTLFRPRTIVNKGSVAFTDVAPNSAAVAGMGNGPAAMAWGNAVGSMARSERTQQPAGLAARNWDNDA